MHNGISLLPGEYVLMRTGGVVGHIIPKAVLGA